MLDIAKGKKIACICVQVCMCVGVTECKGEGDEGVQLLVHGAHLHKYSLVFSWRYNKLLYLHSIFWYVEQLCTTASEKIEKVENP